MLASGYKSHEEHGFNIIMCVLHDDDVCVLAIYSAQRMVSVFIRSLSMYTTFISTTISYKHCEIYIQHKHYISI